MFKFYLAPTDTSLLVAKYPKSLTPLQYHHIIATHFTRWDETKNPYVLKYYGGLFNSNTSNPKSPSIIFCPTFESVILNQTHWYNPVVYHPYQNHLLKVDRVECFPFNKYPRF